MDKYPYTNFHELNLTYFLKHFKEIFEQWDSLYQEMQAWKDQAGADILSWESGVIDDLDVWKAAFEDLFDATFSDLESIKTAAESARDDAIAAKEATEDVAAAVESQAEEYLQPLSSADVALLDTIFDVHTGRYFSANGTRIKQLIDHDTNTEVPEGNSAPAGIVNDVTYLLKVWKYGSYAIYEIQSSSGAKHWYGSTGLTHQQVINWSDRSYDGVMDYIDDINSTLTLKSMQYLTTEEVSALGTIFDVTLGKYFTANGSRIKQLIDHTTNPNVPDGNSAPAGIVNDVTYLLKVWKYGSYAIYEIQSSSGAKHWYGSTGLTHQQVINWSDRSYDGVMEYIISTANERELSVSPTVTGDYLNWLYETYINATGTITHPTGAALSIPINVKPGMVLKNMSAAAESGGTETYLYPVVYNNGTFVKREAKLAYGSTYVVGNDGNQIAFCYGASASAGGETLDQEKIGKYFALNVVTQVAQNKLLVDDSTPLYLAFGASTSWGAVHHRQGNATQTLYPYPTMVGNSLGLKTVNMSIGSVGIIKRTQYQPSVTGYRYNSVAWNNGNNNYMDMILDNDAILQNASLITLSLGVGNDFNITGYTAAQILGEYDDYYPFDEEGYHPGGVEGVAELMQKGCTWFGGLNWIIKRIGERYPKAQLIIMQFHMSDNHNRTVTVAENQGNTSAAPYKLSIVDPFPSTSTAYKMNEGLKTLTDKLKIPFINLFEDGVPFNYYNSNATDANGNYILFSTVEEDGQPVFNVHPNDNGYRMISRYITGRIASMYMKD